MTKPYIICVDDDRTILMSLRAQLKHCFGLQYAYEVAESAAEGWEVIREIYDDGGEVTALISDWLMPGMKGDEFLIQVHREYPDIIKIMLTGQADSDAVRRAQSHANLACCISKPWNKQDLLDVIPAKAAVHE